MKEPPAPEHDKFLPHQEDANVIGQFIEWLPSKGYVLCTWEEGMLGDGQYTMVHASIQELIAEYFGINKKTFDAETEAIYQFIREQANAR